MILQVSGYLMRGSRRGERSRQAKDDDILALCIVGHVNEIWREIFVEIDGRKRVTGFYEVYRTGLAR